MAVPNKLGAGPCSSRLQHINIQEHSQGTEQRADLDGTECLPELKVRPSGGSRSGGCRHLRIGNRGNEGASRGVRLEGKKISASTA
jgi:hypothetical protein